MHSEYDEKKQLLNAICEARDALELKKKKKKRSCFEVIPLDEGSDGHKFSCFDLSQLIDSTHSAILVPLTFQ